MRVASSEARGTFSEHEVAEQEIASLEYSAETLREDERGVTKAGNVRLRCPMNMGTCVTVKWCTSNLAGIRNDTCLWPAYSAGDNWTLALTHHPSALTKRCYNASQGFAPSTSQAMYPWTFFIYLNRWERPGSPRARRGRRSGPPLPRGVYSKMG